MNLKIPKYSMVTTIGSFVAIGLHFLFWGLHFSSEGIFSVVQLPLTVLIILGGIPLVVQIVLKLFQKDFGADLLAALALVTAVVLGEYLASTLIVLMLSSGQLLESYAMRKASQVLLALSQRIPTKAHRKNGPRIEDIAIVDIRVGDHIVIYPHETSPVDGTVVDGNGSMDESYLTGEPYRVSKAAGSSIISGAINGEALLVICADRPASDSRYAKIMEVMIEAEQKRPAMRRLADRIGSIFTPIAFIVAVGAWFFTHDPNRFLSVLVIATPCPLIIAIPITVISAISMAAKRGIIIKDPTVLELLPTCRTALFDKTGTLTYGQPELTEIIVTKNHNSDRVLQFVASLERYSKHPLAQAIINAAKKSNLLLMEAARVSEQPGRGLLGEVDGHTILVTSRKYLLKVDPEAESELPSVDFGLECVIILDDQYIATLKFRDTPRHDGESFIHHLGPKHQFDKVILLSGDRESEVNYLAKQLGIRETLFSQSPEQKLQVVRTEVAKAPTLFMGDGINDAPALTAATVGLAFGHHTSVTAEAAGAVIMDHSLTKVDELFHLSIAMRKIALQSAVGGMILSIIGMGFAAAGVINPVTGAILQEVIDVLAIMNALRLIWSKSLMIDMPVSQK